MRKIATAGIIAACLLLVVALIETALNDWAKGKSPWLSVAILLAMGCVGFYVDKFGSRLLSLFASEETHPANEFVERLIRKQRRGIPKAISSNKSLEQTMRQYAQ